MNKAKKGFMWFAGIAIGISLLVSIIANYGAIKSGYNEIKDDITVKIEQVQGEQDNQENTENTENQEQPTE